MMETDPRQETYRLLIQQMWSDGRIVAEEVTTLTTMQMQLGINAQDAAAIERDIMGQTKEEALVAGMGTNIPPAQGGNAGHAPPHGALGTPVRTPTGGTLSGGQTSGLGGQDIHSTAAGALQPGDIINDRFEILELLGEGGMGQVLKVRDQDLEDFRAMKVVKSELIERDDIHERFRNEVKLCQKLNHTHIVRVYDYGRDRGRGLVYFTMELVEGRTLRGWMVDHAARHQTVSLEEFQKIAKGLCEALTYAHTITIHRDLKPENIMVSDDACKVKLMDFGIAKMLEGPTQYTTGRSLGTAYYIAPEQERGDEIDHRADIYAAGVLLYELLTGRPPRGRFKTPRELRDDVPESLSEAILAAMSAEADERPQDAAALLAALGGLHASDASVDVPYPRPGFTDGDFAELQRLAEAGNSRAMAVLGMSLAAGVCCTIDYREATRWLMSSADKGELLGLVYRAMAHANEEWVWYWEPQLPESPQAAKCDWTRAKGLIEQALDTTPTDPLGLYAAWLNEAHSPLVTPDLSLRRIESLLKRAVDQDLVPAMRDLSHLYCEDTLGLPYELEVNPLANTRDSLRLRQQAAACGDAVAMFSLAGAFHCGEGVSEDCGEAARWYHKALDAGFLPASSFLAWQYWDGDGVYQDFAKAVELAQIDSKNPASRLLGHACYYGRGVPQDFGAAVVWYEKSSGHDGESSMNLADCYYNGHSVAQNLTRAVELYRKAAEAGIAPAMCAMGRAYYQGKGVPQDFREAATWLQKGVDASDGLSTYALANCYYNGQGVAKNISKAVELYKQAAGHGIEEAKEALENLSQPSAVPPPVCAKLRLSVAGKTFDYDEFPVILGREPGVHLKLNTNAVSRKHCEFFVHNGKWAVRDLGSRNGTFVNGKRTDKNGMFLLGTNEIRLGNVRESPLLRAEILGISGIPKERPVLRR